MDAWKRKLLDLVWWSTFVVEFEFEFVRLKERVVRGFDLG